MAFRGGIDLGGTKIQAVVVDDDNRVLGQARHPTPTSGGPQDVTEAMAGALREAASIAEVETTELAGAGVGSPGAIDAAKGIVSQAKNLPDWDGDFPLAARLSDAIGTRVALGNDVSVAVDAEVALGAGKGARSLLGVFWGTGVGGAVVLGGRRWDGEGAAGEIGHMVVKINGARCGCGRRGCMEAYAGRASMEARARKREEDGEKTELFHLMKKHDRPRLTSGIWARALAHEDKLAIELIDEAVAALGAGVASAVNLLDVEVVVIGGGLGLRLGEEYRQRIADAMQPHLFNDERPPDIRLAQLGDFGGAIGAALLVA
ncbi:MAG TPA: ROK family protein [Conexibacter sp.]|jgi:glucokinase